MLTKGSQGPRFARSDIRYWQKAVFQRVSASSVLALRRRIGYVIQEGGLFAHLTAAQNVFLMMIFIFFRNTKRCFFTGSIWTVVPWRRWKNSWARSMKRA